MDVTCGIGDCLMKQPGVMVCSSWKVDGREQLGPMRGRRLLPLARTPLARVAQSCNGRGRGRADRVALHFPRVQGGAHVTLFIE